MRWPYCARFAGWCIGAAPLPIEGVDRERVANMTTIATNDGYSAPLLAYAPPADTKAEAGRLRLVLVIVLMWAILKVAGRVIGWIHWGFPDSSQWLSMTPARVIERSFMFFLLPLFNLVLTVVAIR